MKVLIISTLYPNPSNLTFGVFVHEQVKQLIKFGIDVRVICPISITPPLRLLKLKKGILREWKNWILNRWNIPKEYTLEGVNIYYPRLILLPKVFFPQFEAPTFFCSIKRLLNRIWRDWNWDIVHAHFLTPNGIVAEKIAKKYGNPLVISCLGDDLFHYAKRKTLYDSIKSALHFSSAIICKSSQLRESAIKFGAEPEQVHEIYNGCDLVEFKSSNRNNKLNEILFIGYFIERKCLGYLIEAFRNLKNKQFKLRLIGDGELLTQIRKAVFDHNLQDRVIFQGIVPHALISDCLNNAALLCLPSRSEGTPNVIMEALACGTPVIATRVGGVPDIVPSFCGILVPPKDAGALQNALEVALERNWDYQAIRKYAEQNLSSEGQCKKIIKMYQGISLQ